MNFQEAYGMLADKISGWLEGVILMLPNLLIAVIVLVAFYITAKILRKGIRKWMKHVSKNLALNKLFSTIIYFGTIVTGCFIALEILNLEKTVTSLLAGVGIIGLALGFAFQDIASNFISGIIIALQRPFRKGDLLESNGYRGIVDNINIRTTEITTLDGLDIIIPNKDVLGNPIKNYSKTKDRRVEFNVGISYAEDLEKVKKITLESLKKIKEINRDKPTEFFYTEFADSSINFLLRFWLKTPMEKDYLDAKNKAIISIKKAYDKNKITIPFPIRTLDFGIKGGENLSKSLSKKN